MNRALRAGNVETTKKYGGGGNVQSGTHLNTKSLDEDMENLKVGIFAEASGVKALSH